METVMKIEEWETEDHEVMMIEKNYKDQYLKQCYMKNLIYLISIA